MQIILERTACRRTFLQKWKRVMNVMRIELIAKLGVEVGKGGKRMV